MLKRWLDPLLLLIGLTGGIFAIYSGQQAGPVQFSPAATPTPPSGLPTPVSGDPKDDGTTPMPPELQDVDAVLVIDNSGSMFGYTCTDLEPLPANDAEQMRIRSAEIVIASLAADLKPRETSLAIVSFGNSAELLSPLRQLNSEVTDPTRTELIEAVRNPPCAGDTNIVEALQVALTELRSERHNPNNIPAIIFLTDGLPTLGGDVAEIRHVLDELQADNVLLFTILLGGDPQLAEFGQFWQDEAEVRPNVEFERLLSADQMVDVYQEIKMTLDQRNNAPVDMPRLPSGPSVTVTMPPHVEQAVLTVLKPAVDTQVTLTDPAGNDASLRPPNSFRRLQNNSTIDVFMIDRPEDGDWVLRSAGGEEIVVLQPEIKSVYAVQMVQPDASQPLSIDRPTDIVVQVVDRTSNPPLPLPGPFALTSSYRLLDQPPNAATPLTMKQSPTDLLQYRVTLPAGTFADLSTYVFTFQAQDSIGLRSNEAVYQLDAGRVPSIVSFTAQQHLYVDEQTTLNVTVAHPESADGQPIPRVPHAVPNNASLIFTAQTSTTFRATMQPLEQPGDYTINVIYMGKTRLGHNFSDQRSVQITVEERTLTIWLRNLSTLVTLLVMAYLLYRYVLIPYTPLVPIAQKLGVAPQGYIRVQPNDGSRLPGAQQDLTRLLQKRRKLLRLTLGPACDISLSSPDTTAALPPPDPDDESAPRTKKSRPDWRERLLGKRPLAVIGREFRGDTFIQRYPNGAPQRFKEYTDTYDIVDHTIEFSLEKFS